MTFTTKKFDGMCAVFDPPGNNFPKGGVRLTVEPPERCDALKKNLRLNLPVINRRIVLRTEKLLRGTKLGRTNDISLQKVSKKFRQIVA